MHRIVTTAVSSVLLIVVSSCLLGGTALVPRDAGTIVGGCPVTCETWKCPNGQEADDPCEDNVLDCGCYTYWESVSRVAGPGGDKQSRSSCCGTHYDCDLEITPEGKPKCVKKENYCPGTWCTDPLLGDAKYRTSYRKCY